MVAGLVSSNAQVYSANIVGYVNSTAVGSGGFTLLATPLDNSGSNDVISLIGAALPNKSVVEIWDPVGATFDSMTKVSGVWNTNYQIPPGTGFFVKTPTTGGAASNTFVGNVISAAFGYSNPTNSQNLISGYQLVGSPLPIAGTLTDAGPDTINLGAVLPNKSVIEVWDPVGQTFNSATKVSGVWNTNFTIGVGQGFFINAKSATNWTQVLQ